MMELLTLPAWNAPPRTLDDWRTALTAQGYAPAVHREQGVFWIEVAPLRLRGYVVTEDQHVSAINFELHDPDPDPAWTVVESAAQALGWEVHPDDEDEEEDIEED